MIINIKQERILKLINNKIVEVLDVENCKAFDEYLCINFLWDEGYKDLINWQLVPNFKQIKNVQLFSNEAKEFIKSTSLSKFEYLAIVYSAAEPGVVGRFEDIINNLSNLSFHTPWVEFIVGAQKNKYGIFELINKDFIEAWVGKCILSAAN